MKRILFALLIVILFYPFSAFGEIKIITHAVKQPFGGSQSPDDARIAAVAKAKREALEMAGTYVESTTVVKNAQVEKDEILALTAGVLKAEVVSQKNYTTGDAFGIEVAVRVEVDTSVLEARLKKVLEDKPHLEQLKQARAREKELLEKIAVLDKENRKRGKSDQKAANLKKEFQATSRGLTAVDWVNKATALWENIEGYDSKEEIKLNEKAIEYLNEAIRLKPDYVEAYYSRGTKYQMLAIAYWWRSMGNNKNHDQYWQWAIKDYDKAIRLKPDYGEAYHSRGFSYFALHQYQRAIKDYTDGIRIQLNQYQRAIKDGEGVRLQRDRFFLSRSYASRGNAYERLGLDERAISDYDEAIRLVSSYSNYYVSRGQTYYRMKQYQRAISDFDEAIRLDPDDGKAHENRGKAYIESGNSQEGCHSLIRACELEDCSSYNLEKQKGKCQ